MTHWKGYEPIDDVLLHEDSLLGQLIVTASIADPSTPIGLNVDDNRVVTMSIDQCDLLIAHLTRARNDVLLVRGIPNKDEVH